MAAVSKPTTPIATLTSEAIQLERKRKLIEAMQAQGLQKSPYTVDAGRGNVVANFADPIAKVASAYFGDQASQAADALEKANAEKQQTQRGEAIENYFTTKEGGEQVIGQDTRALDVSGEEGAPPDARGIMPGDPKRAIKDALMSNDPFMMGLAARDYEGMRKKPGEYLKVPGASLDSRVAADQSGDVSQLKPEPKEHVVGDRLISGVPGKDYKVGFDGRPLYGDVGPIPGAPGTFGQTESTTGKVAFAPRDRTTNINLPENKGETKFEQDMAVDEVKRLSAGRDATKAAANSIPTLVQAHDLAKSAITGFGAEQILGARRLAKQMGLSEDQANQISDSQTYLVVMAPKVLELIKALRPASDQDVKFAREVTASDLTRDPLTMQRATRLLATEGYKTGQAHMEQLDASSRIRPNSRERIQANYGVKLPVMPEGWMEQTPAGPAATMNMPPQAAPAGGGYVPDDETKALIRGYRGR
jgi:hypothetical protein